MSEYCCIAVVYKTILPAFYS